MSYWQQEIIHKASKYAATKEFTRQGNLIYSQAIEYIDIFYMLKKQAKKKKSYRRGV